MKAHRMQVFNQRPTDKSLQTVQLTFLPRLPRGPFSPWGPDDDDDDGAARFENEKQIMMLCI